jgi:protein-disulfide isomerase
VSERIPEVPDTEAIQERRQRRLLGALVGLGLALLLGGTGVATWLVMREGKPGAGARATASGAPAASSAASPAPERPVMPTSRARGATTHPADTTALLPVPAGAAVWGDRDALVTLVIFGDLTCPFTARALASLPSLASRFGEELRVVFKFYPTPGNADAQRAATAAAIAWGAGGTDVFWKFVQAASHTHGKLDEATLDALGVEAGLGAGALAGKLAAPPPAILAQDLELGRLLGVRGTPVLFLNGRRLDGLQPSVRLIKVIEHELRRIRPMLTKGTPREQIYAERVRTNITTSEGEKLPP